MVLTGATIRTEREGRVTAKRYWVGTTGSWASTSNWSATSGGASGASVPTSSDDVYFDSNSNSGTASLAGNSSVGTLTMEASAGCTVDAGTYILEILRGCTISSTNMLEASDTGNDSLYIASATNAGTFHFDEDTTSIVGGVDIGNSTGGDVIMTGYLNAEYISISLLATTTKDIIFRNFYGLIQNFQQNASVTIGFENAYLVSDGGLSLCTFRNGQNFAGDKFDSLHILGLDIDADATDVYVSTLVVDANRIVSVDIPFSGSLEIDNVYILHRELRPLDNVKINNLFVGTVNENIPDYLYSQASSTTTRPTFSITSASDATQIDIGKMYVRNNTGSSASDSYDWNNDTPVLINIRELDMVIGYTMTWNFASDPIITVAKLNVRTEGSGSITVSGEATIAFIGKYGTFEASIYDGLEFTGGTVNVIDENVVGGSYRND